MKKTLIAIFLIIQVFAGIVFVLIEHMPEEVIKFTAEYYARASFVTLAAVVIILIYERIIEAGKENFDDIGNY